MRVFFFTGFIAACLTLSSCFDRGDCLLNSTGDIKFSLFTTDSPYVAKKVLFKAIVLPDVGIVYNTPDSLSTFALRSDPDMKSTKYVFQYGNRSDTLVLAYNQQTVVLSPDCGAYNYRKDLSVQHSTFGINKVVVVDPALLTTSAVNVQIRL